MNIMNVRAWVLLTCFIACSTQAKSSAEVIRFAVGEYPPELTEQREDFGLLADFVTKACRLVNLEPKYDFFNWNKAKYAVEIGKYVASFPWRKTPEREAQFTFSKVPVSQGGNIAFYLDESLKLPTWKQYTNLNSFSLIGVKGYWYEKEFEAMGSKAFLARDAQHAWQLLQIGRVQILADTYLAGKYDAERYLPAEKFKQLRFKPSSIPPIPAFIMFSKKHPQSSEMLKRLDEALSKLHENGTFDELYNPGSQQGGQIRR